MVLTNVVLELRLLCVGAKTIILYQNDEDEKSSFLIDRTDVLKTIHIVSNLFP
jgi:hypothetical protein